MREDDPTKAASSTPWRRRPRGHARRPDGRHRRRGQLPRQDRHDQRRQRPLRLLPRGSGNGRLLDPHEQRLDLFGRNLPRTRWPRRSPATEASPKLRRLRAREIDGRSETQLFRCAPQAQERLQRPDQGFPRALGSKHRDRAIAALAADAEGCSTTTSSSRSALTRSAIARRARNGRLSPPTRRRLRGGSSQRVAQRTVYRSSKSVRPVPL